MHIRCEHCGAGYELDLPRSALNHSTRKLKFRCSACGRSFVVRPPGRPGAPDGDLIRPASGAPAGRGMLLKQEGKVYHVSDVATLQRWIVERRVLADDLISAGDGNWERVGTRADMAPFFQVVEQADLLGGGRPLMQVGGDDLPGVDDTYDLAAAGARPVGGPAQPTIIPSEDGSREAPSGAEATWPVDLGPRGPAVAPQVLGQAPASGRAAPTFDDATVRVAPPAVRPEVAFDDVTAEGGVRRQASPDDPTDDVRPVGGSSILHVSPALEIRADERDDDEDYRPRRRWWPILLILFVLGAGGLGAGWWAWLLYQQGELGFVDKLLGGAAPPSAPAVEAEPVVPPPEPAEPPSEAAPAEAEAADEPVVAEEAPPPAEPEPPPEAEPAPASNGGGSSTASLVKRGWSALDSGNLSLAESLFSQALGRNSTDADANFGLGYVYEQYGRKETAVSYYCKARSYAGSNVDLDREVAGRLRVLGAVCP